MTLPFKADSLESRKLVVKMIDRTRNRWAWFVEARRLDLAKQTRLGTLGYVPTETRLEVFAMTLNGHYEDFTNKMSLGTGENEFYYLAPSEKVEHRLSRWRLEYQPRHRRGDTHDIFSLGSFFWGYYYSGYSEKEAWEKVNLRPALRLTSLTVQEEFDELYLNNTTFKFARPRALNNFLGRLSPLQLSHLRKFHLKLFCQCESCYGNGPNNLKAWMRAGETLPSTLELIHITFGGEPTKVSGIKKTAELLEFLAKRFPRVAPNVKMAMKNEVYFLEEDRLVLGEILCSVDCITKGNGDQSCEAEDARLSSGSDESEYFSIVGSELAADTQKR